MQNAKHGEKEPQSEEEDPQSKSEHPIAMEDGRDKREVRRTYRRIAPVRIYYKWKQNRRDYVGSQEIASKISMNG
jgi:hypothetical protein